LERNSRCSGLPDTSEPASLGLGDQADPFRRRTGEPEVLLERLNAFASNWRKRHPTIAPLWHRERKYLTPMFAIPPANRSMTFRTK
jgi:hypothetical protein